MPEDQDKSREPISDSKLHREYLFAAIVFTVVAPLYVWISLADPWGIDLKWLGPIGALLFGVIAVLSWVSYFKRLPVEKSDQLIMRTFGRIVLAPIALAALAVIVAGVFFGFSWLFSIPSWAAVIIVLLLLLIAKR